MTIANTEHSADDAGFTLLEMIAAICMIALAVTLVMPRISASRQAMKLRSTAVQLASNIKITRAAAKTANIDTVFVINTASRTYAAAGAVKPTLIPRDIALSFKAKVAETAVASHGGFSFRPDGTASGGEIKLQSGSDTAMIAIDWLTGAVTLNVR